MKEKLKKKVTWIKDHKEEIIGTAITGISLGLGIYVGRGICKRRAEHEREGMEILNTLMKANEDIVHFPMQVKLYKGNLKDFFMDKSARETVAIIDGIKLSDLGDVGAQLATIDPMMELADTCVTIEMNYCTF